MAFPSTPINGQTYTEPATGRKWSFNSTNSSWYPLERSDLNDLDDVDISTTAPTNLQTLTYDNGNWVPKTIPTAGAYVPIIEATSNPTSGMTNLSSPGTVWRNTSTKEVWIATQEADSTGLTTYQTNTATNPSGANAYSLGSVWGINFIAAFDFTINSIGVYWNSYGAGSTVTINLYSGFNGSSLITTAAATTDSTARTNYWRDLVLREEVDLTAGGNYSIEVASTNASHTIGYTGTSVLYPSQYDADNDSDATSTAMVANDHVGVMRVGYKGTQAGTYWWKLGSFSVDGLSTLQRVATPPAAPVDGQVYYNTALSALFIYDGSNGNWIQCVN